MARSRKVGNKSNAVIWVGLALMVTALIIGWSFLPVENWIQQFSEWVRGFGAPGVILFGIVYIVAVVALAPASPFTVAAGLAYGAWAFPLVLVSATVGATLAFLVARYLVRGRVKEAVETRPTLGAVDKAVGEDGWKIVVLLRLSPLVPFNLQNYFFGVTKIGLLPYMVATFVGIIPGTMLYVYIGALGKTAGEGMSGVQWALFGLGLLATAIVAFIITRKAKMKLKQAGIGKTPS